MSRSRLLLLLGILLLGTEAAWAHVASNSFLGVEVRGSTLEGSMELAVRDVELAVGVDAKGDGKITWGELRAATPRLEPYLRQHLSFQTRGAACMVEFGALEVNERTDGNYAWLPFTARCAAEIRELTIGYRVLDGVDPSHRALLRLSAGKVVQTAVLGGRAAEMTLTVDHPAIWRTIQEYGSAGVWHIWSGIDHLLFLLSLLLPAVLWRRDGGWQPIGHARPAFISILKVVTAFTVAHSLTLSLAAFNIVHLPSRLTESVIAASIIVAALNNVFPIVTESRAQIAFAFGLLHGFGFASVLAEMGLPDGARLISLVAFNGGIELGQLAVVLAVMPVAYALRKEVLYRRALLPWGSAAIAMLAFVWFVQRAFLAS